MQWEHCALLMLVCKDVKQLPAVVMSSPTPPYFREGSIPLKRLHDLPNPVAALKTYRLGGQARSTCQELRALQYFKRSQCKAQ